MAAQQAVGAPAAGLGGAPQQGGSFNPMFPPQEIVEQLTTFGHCLVAAGLYRQGQPPVVTPAVTALYESTGLDPSTPAGFVAVRPDADIESIIADW